jgi:hypothetical protein
MSMTPPTTPEHDWLRRLVGRWNAEGSAEMGDGQVEGWKAEETVRAIGDVWIQCEGHGQMPEGGTSTTQMTLGYDATRQRFVGTFLGSMMTHLWVYEGQLDAAGKVLTLDTVGPDFADPTKMCKYQDVIELVSPDHRVLRSQVQGEDGAWTQIMRADYRRV